MLASSGAWSILYAGPSRGDVASRRHPRVVALDWGWAETLVALGRPPVAVVERAGYQDIVVEPALPQEVLDLGVHTEPNLERLHRLKPDLVVSTPALETIRHLVEKVAPVLSLPVFPAPEGALRKARQQTLVLADAIGARSEGEAYLARADLELARARAKTRRPEEPVLLARIVDARHAVVYGRSSLLQGVLEELQLTNAWQHPTNAYGTASIGLEQLAGIPDARLISIGMGGAGAVERPSGPFWDALPFVRNDRVLTLPSVWAFGAVPSAMRFAGLLGDALALAPEERRRS